jgi:hypothetical protein
MPDLYADLHLTETALALYRTNLSLREQEINLQIKIDSATSFAASTQTQAYKNDAEGTKQAAIQYNGTPTAAALTSTAYAPTAQVIQQQVYASMVTSWLTPIALAVLIALAGLAIWRGIEIWRFQKLQLAPNDKGQYNIVPENAFPGDVLLNVNIAHRSTISSKNDDLTSDQALQNKDHDRMKDVAMFATNPVKQEKKEPPVQTAPIVQPTPNTKPAIPVTAPQLLLETEMNKVPQADWSLMESWDGKGAIPYGVDKDGLARVDISSNYHFGAFGATGEGKSRRFIRPFVAALLANGQRVILLGKTGDFWPFEQHPNATIIPIRKLTETNEAQRYAAYLRRMVEEMNDRDEYLTSRHVSTWQHAGHENTYIVLDEIGNAVEQMQQQQRDECMRWIVSLVKQGRKNGFCVVTASQRAVGFKNIVEQMDRVVYRLSDEASSRIALGEAGAERLPKNSGLFFNKFNSVKLCSSFEPTDDQLNEFLKRDVKVLEPMIWLEASVGEEQSPPVIQLQEDPAPIVADENPVMEKMDRILELKAEGKSESFIIREIWNVTGGGSYVKLQRQLREALASTTSTSTSFSTTSA